MAVNIGPAMVYFLDIVQNKEEKQTESWYAFYAYFKLPVTRKRDVKGLLGWR